MTALANAIYSPTTFPAGSLTTDELLAELRLLPTDLARFVNAAGRSTLPYMLVTSAALKGWKQRHPEAWANMSEWLTAQGKAVVEV